MPNESPAKLWAGQYELIRPLGKGGFGEVWLAHDPLLHGRYVAVKRIHQANLDAQMLIDEMRMLDRINHPNVVKFLHHTQEDDELYLVMEYCHGGNLLDHSKCQPVAYDKVFFWGFTLATALAKVHDHKIVHHDIKPRNILVTDLGELKIADFGVANRNAGTTAYLAPEFFFQDSDTRHDPRIDVYALGITLLELLLGEPLFDGVSDKEMMQSKLAHDFIPPVLNQWVQAILLKATHPTPEQRFQNMTDFAHAIRSRHVPFVLDGNKMKAHGYAEKAARLLARKRWLSAKKHLEQALLIDPNCVAAHISAGRVNLLLRRMKIAKEHFQTALRLNPHVALQKELGWLALEDGYHSLAISMLNDHLQRNAVDFEACNLLIQCFFETERYEYGVQLAENVIKQRPGHACFENNLYICKVMQEEGSIGTVQSVSKTRLANPFMRFNYDILTENPASWSHSAGPSLKGKLLFQDYRFGRQPQKGKVAEGKVDGSVNGNVNGDTSIEPDNNAAQRLVINMNDGYRYTFTCSLITLGRFSSNVIPLNQNGVSRRHAVIINYPNDAWVYDLGSYSGVQVDNAKITRKTYLHGRHRLVMGPVQFDLMTGEDFLL